MAYRAGALQSWADRQSLFCQNVLSQDSPKFNDVTVSRYTVYVMHDLLYLISLDFVSSAEDNLISIYELDPLNRHITTSSYYSSPNSYIMSPSSTIVQIVLIAESARWAWLIT